MILKGDAIVLRCIDYSNTSQIVNLFTKNQGKISLIAKGSKRQSKSKAADSLGLLTVISVVYYQKRIDQMAVLKEHSLKQYYPGIRQRLGKIYSALYCIEMLRECTNEGESNSPLFTAICMAFKELENCRCPVNAFLHAHWQLLVILGMTPHLEGCMHCHLPVFEIERGNPFYFSPQKGGLLCHKCLGNTGVTVRFSQSTGKKVFALLAQDRADESISLTPGEYREIYTIFRFHLRTVLGKELRMSRYLCDYQGIAEGNALR